MNARDSHPATALPEEVFRAAFRHSPALQSVVRASDGVFVQVNDTFLQKFGFSQEQVIGRTPVELDFWVDRERQATWKQRLEEHGLVTGFETLLRDVDGRVFTVLLSTHAVDIGGVRHYLTAGVDISLRKEAEAKLRERERQLEESEARFRAAFNASPVMQSIVRFSDDVIVEINPTLTKILGYKRDEVIGRTPAELNFWSSPGRVPALRAEIAANRRVRGREIDVRAKDGSVRTVLFSSELVEIDGEPHSLNASVDITERKASDARLQENEARMRSLYDALSAAVVVHDEEAILQVNQAAVQLFGARSADEMMGASLGLTSASTQPDGEPSAVAAPRHMARARAEGRHRFEWLARSFDGREIPVEVTLTPLKLAGRAVMQAVVLDLSERKRAEAELQKALQRERELSQLKSEFVSLVSHEFRTPLEVIMSSTDNLERYQERLAPEQRAELFKTIHKSVRRMADMMGEVLMLGRLESERMPFRPGPLDIASLLRRLCDEIASATGRRCHIDLELRGALDQARGDESVLRHIFSNLLSNAIKYSPPGSQVILRVVRSGNDAVFRFTDQGCGIPAADQKRLFQAFHRGSNVGGVPGTGLGLLIVQRCVALHGGALAVDSAENQGTTVTVSVPLFQPSLSVQ